MFSRQPTVPSNFETARPRELALTAQAAGLAPVVTSIVVNANIDLRLVLPKGRRLHGKVLDESGQPIASASIEAVSPSADSRTLFEWRTKTDVKGHFTWDYAPATQEYAVSASGYETRSRIKLHADSEQIIQLDRKNTLPAVRILGQIIDAQNKQPLTGGRIQIWQTTKEPGGGMSTFTTRAEAAGPDGKFRTKTSSGTLNYVLEAQADGYWPKRLTNDVIGQAEVWLDMEMEKAPLVAGRVLTPAGQAAAGATLVVCGANEWAQLNATGKFQVGRHTTIATAQTDANGRFRLPPTYAPEVVAVAHPEGFVQVPFALMTSNTTLILQPWGGIKGTVRLAGKPLANETIRLIGLPEHVSRTLRVIPTFDVETDAEGRFAFALVPPGEWKVERDINQPERRTLGIRIPVFSHGVRAVVSPGEIATVTLGGHGRPVIGQAIAPTTVAPEIWIENSVTLLLKTAKSERFTYSAMFAPDGSFRIEDVPSGDYVLKIHLAEPPKPAEGNRGRFVPLASLERDVTVLGGTGTFDLGALLLSHAN